MLLSQHWKQQRTNSDAPTKNREPSVRPHQEWAAKEEEGPGGEYEHGKHKPRPGFLANMTTAEVHHDGIGQDEKLCTDQNPTPRSRSGLNVRAHAG